MTDQPRVRLTKKRVVEAAIQVADEGGAESLTMRGLADRLGVEAMSPYYYVGNKEGLLNEMVDAIVNEIEIADGGFDAPQSGGWKETLRKRILTAREVMLRHPWAPGVIETRSTMSPVVMRYFDRILGIMIEGGFSYELGHYAIHALSSRAFGFGQELFAPEGDVDMPEAEVMMQQMAEHLPYMTAMLADIVQHDHGDAKLGWCDYQAEFEFSLDLILDGLEARL